jgi:hypothetical protein
MAMFKASRTSISFRMNLSDLVSGHVGGAVVNCIVCTFVCVFLLVTGFTPAWFGHYGFLLEEEGLVRQAGEKNLRCAPFGWCGETKRLRSWSEDGACDVQTRAARCGEHGESRMVCPLCTNRMLLLVEGPMRGREDLR